MPARSSALNAAHQPSGLVIYNLNFNHESAPFKVHSIHPVSSCVAPGTAERTVEAGTRRIGPAGCSL
eukprot:COSAG02_NODE_3037_length_7501_cov_5.769116_4_plen_67_part_00